jgi:hypothetical protein
VPLFLRYAPVLNLPSLRIHEVVNIDPSLYNTSLSLGAALRNDVVYVANSSGLSVDDFIRIGNLASKYFIGKIKAINSSEVILYSPLGSTIPAGEEVAKITTVERTLGVDYSVDLISGEVNLLPGNLTDNNKLIAEYISEFTPEFFALYIVEGDSVIPISQGFSDIDHDTVSSHPLAVEVNDEILSVNNSYADVLSTDQNGMTFTYYFFAKDRIGRHSYAQTISFESIPSVPQGITARIDDNVVLLEWDVLPSASDANTDGFNVFRCDGEVFVPDQAIQLNSSLISSLTPAFEDSALNVVNRNVTIDAPENGNYYCYKVESEDTLTSWVVGTQNEIGTVLENQFARK